ncbi:hypothetical protein HY251_15595, partial [bacterium]|nr:hypothetical protein [bacterium]
MDATREHLLGRIVLERRIVLEDELRRLLGERDDLMRRGNASVSLGQLLVRDRRLDVAQLIGLQNEIEVRGRACFACRRAYLVAAGGPATCPACGGSALLPAAGGAPPRPASTPPPSYPATPAPGYMDDYSPSGRFVNSQASAVARANANVNSSGVVRSGGPPSGVARPGPTSSARMRAAAATHAGDGSAHAPAWQQAAVGSLPSTDPGSKSSSKGSGGAQGSGPAAAAARS